MRLLSGLVLIALSASPALADEAVPDAAPAQVAAPQSQPAAQDLQPKKKRALACPACATSEMPSFAIRPATEQSAAAAGTTPGGAAADPSQGAASQPPVNFSFSASGDSYSNRNRYRGGVYMATPF